jgi:hypothetical protein
MVSRVKKPSKAAGYRGDKSNRTSLVPISSNFFYPNRHSQTGGSTSNQPVLPEPKTGTVPEKNPSGEDV